MDVSLRPVGEDDLPMLRRFLIEPGLLATDWHGYRDPRTVERRFGEDGFLGTENGRLMIDVSHEPAAAGGVGGEPAAAPGVGREPGVGEPTPASDREEPVAAGFVTWSEVRYSGTAGGWEIGIALLPEFRGRGIGWRAQAMIVDYLFEHTPAQRIQAGTQPENIAEQKSLLKAGFQLEGVIRAAEFRAGRWRDCLLYSRLRTDSRDAK